MLILTKYKYLIYKFLQNLFYYLYLLFYLICYMSYPIINSINLYNLTYPKYGWFSKLSLYRVEC